ncbi:MAG: aspartate carbamoyltransferase regulatory subunit, partial [Candidatus Cloacimonadota bacterium]
DIIKIENRELTQEEVNSISLIAPTASLSIIKNFEVTKKAKVQIPDTVEGLIICPNPKCITNTENISTKFDIISKSVGCLTEKPIKLRCIYCEKVYSTEQVKIKI